MIPKRVFWFAAGTASGFAAAVWSYTRVRELRGRYEADQVADTLVSMGRAVGSSIKDAVVEGREAMHDAEARIIGDLDARSGAPHRLRGSAASVR